MCVLAATLAVLLVAEQLLFLFARDLVEQVGAAVADLAPGDPVVISFPWCGECGPCRAERISYCERAARSNRAARSQ